MSKAEEEKKVERKEPVPVSIFWVLSVLMILLVVVPLVSYSWISINSSKDYIEESLRERQLKTAIPAAAHLEMQVGENKRRLQDLAAVFELYSNEPDSKVQYENLLQRGVLNKYLTDDVLLLSYQDRAGEQFYAPWRGLRASETSQLEQYLAGVARQAIAAGKLRRSPVFTARLQALGELGEPAMVVSFPVRSEGKSVSAVSAVFLLENIQQSLQDYGSDYTLFVTNSKGRLLFHSQPSMQGTEADLSKDPIVNRVLASWPPPSGAVNYNVTKVEDGKAKTFLVTSTYIPAYGWILFSKVDREKYYAPIVQLKKRSTVWVFLSIISALIIGIVLARLITKPLSTLAEVSRDLARGEFSRRANIKSKNEIGELARAFNAMADDIQQYIGQVEKAAEENKQLFMNSIRAIANALDAKDPYTRGHSERVSAYAMVIGREFGLDARSLRILEISSLLHDVGKIGIEDKILRKPGALTVKEFTIMKTHPAKGAQILGSIPQMKEIIPGIRYHHERWSGGGYPDGIKEEQIPLIARIMGVADAFDAMTTNRPYQRAMTPVQAANRINELKITVYETKVVEAFNKAFRKGLFKPVQSNVAGKA